MTSLAVAGSLLLGVAAPAVLADTFPAGNADLYAASSSWDSGESNIGIGATVGTQDGVAVHSLSVSSFLVQDITCKGKDKTGISLVYTLGESLDATIKIDAKLGSASASGTLSGTEEVFNSCTGADTFRDISFQASFALTASGAISTSKTRSVTNNPDGSKSTSTDKFDSRDATGSFSISGVSYTPTFSNISHDVSTFTTVPPRH